VAKKKKPEATYSLTFMGVLCATGVDDRAVRQALYAQFFARGLGTSPGTHPAIVFERDKDGRLGPGTLTEVGYNETGDTCK